MSPSKHGILLSLLSDPKIKTTKVTEHRSYLMPVIVAKRNEVVK